MKLRWYQEQAVDAALSYLDAHKVGNPCIVLPTGAGKTPVIATLVKKAAAWNARVLILAHVKELLQQAVDKLSIICPEVDIGVYSAGLGSRQTEQSVIVAGIQSVHHRAFELGSFHLVLIDEAHLVPPDGEGMYRSLLDNLMIVNPNMRVVGLTATPYRMKSGLICGEENILHEICYEVGVKELIVQEYLCPIVSRGSRQKIDLGGLHIRAGEFIASEVEDLMDSEERVAEAVDEIITYTDPGRNSVLVFAAGVAHAEHIAADLRAKTNANVEIVTGDTSPEQRATYLEEFKAGSIKYLVNVNVLTTGFDAPNVDCVAMVRPTASPGLYYQMVGRGLRLHESKTECLVLDFGGNVLRHGPIDAIAVQGRGAGGAGDTPQKTCPECQAIIAAGYTSCPECQFTFPLPERKLHDARATEGAILSGQEVANVTYETHEPYSVEYAVHHKKGAPDAPTTLKVTYLYETDGLYRYEAISEWVCLNHSGFARAKAESWWRKRTDCPVPDTTEDACELALRGVLADVRSIKIAHVEGERWPKLVDVDLAEKPEFDPSVLERGDASFDFGGPSDFGLEGVPF